MTIKFNAWDKFENKMILWKDLIKDKESEKLISEILLNSERYIPLQFTGRYGKKHTKEVYLEEVYLGDICKCRYYKHAEPDLYLIQEIYFIDGTFAVKTTSTDATINDDVYSNCSINLVDVLEKVGNIYEGLKIDL